MEESSNLNSENPVHMGETEFTDSPHDLIQPEEGLETQDDDVLGNSGNFASETTDMSPSEPLDTPITPVEFKEIEQENGGSMGGAEMGIESKELTLDGSSPTESNHEPPGLDTSNREASEQEEQTESEMNVEGDDDTGEGPTIMTDGIDTVEQHGDFNQDVPGESDGTDALNYENISGTACGSNELPEELFESSEQAELTASSVDKPFETSSDNNAELISNESVVILNDDSKIETNADEAGEDDGKSIQLENDADGLTTVQIPAELLDDTDTRIMEADGYQLHTAEYEQSLAYDSSQDQERDSEEVKVDDSLERESSDIEEFDMAVRENADQIHELHVEPDVDENTHPEEDIGQFSDSQQAYPQTDQESRYTSEEQGLVQDDTSGQHDITSDIDNSGGGDEHGDTPERPPYEVDHDDTLVETSIMVERSDEPNPERIDSEEMNEDHFVGTPDSYPDNLASGDVVQPDHDELFQSDELLEAEHTEQIPTMVEDNENTEDQQHISHDSGSEERSSDELLTEHNAPNPIQDVESDQVETRISDATTDYVDDDIDDDEKLPDKNLREGDLPTESMKSQLDTEISEINDILVEEPGSVESAERMGYHDSMREPDHLTIQETEESETPIIAKDGIEYEVDISDVVTTSPQATGESIPSESTTIETDGTTHPHVLDPMTPETDMAVTTGDSELETYEMPLSDVNGIVGNAVKESIAIEEEGMGFELESNGEIEDECIDTGNLTEYEVVDILPEQPGASGHSTVTECHAFADEEVSMLNEEDVIPYDQTYEEAYISEHLATPIEIPVPGDMNELSRDVWTGHVEEKHTENGVDDGETNERLISGAGPYETTTLSNVENEVTRYEQHEGLITESPEETCGVEEYILSHGELSEGVIIVQQPDDLHEPLSRDDDESHLIATEEAHSEMKEVDDGFVKEQILTVSMELEACERRNEVISEESGNNYSTESSKTPEEIEEITPVNVVSENAEAGRIDEPPTAYLGTEHELIDEKVNLVIKSEEVPEEDTGKLVNDLDGELIFKNHILPSTDEKTYSMVQKRSRTLEPSVMKTWNDGFVEPQKKSATLGRSGSKRRGKLQPRPTINDDHLFPDSVTPSKVENDLSVRSLNKGLPKGTYDVPYIDDDAFLPKKLRAKENRGSLTGSEYSSEGPEWFEPSMNAKYGYLDPSHVADVDECIPTPKLATKTHSSPQKKKKSSKKGDLIEDKKDKPKPRSRFLELCSCFGRRRDS